MTKKTRRIVLVSGAAVIAAAVTFTAIGIGGSAENGNQTASNLPPATYTVAKADLTDTEKITGGVLVYDGPHLSVLAPPDGGTVTWLAPKDSTVALGQQVYKVNDKAVVLIHGWIPPYRDLQSGVIGADVKQFEQSLKALGYTGFTVDDQYTSATATAVKKWQKDLGLEQTGVVKVGQIVVAPGNIRIATHGVGVGAPLGGGATVLTYSGTNRIVTVELDASKQHLVKEGVPATLTLTDGTELAGTVTQVSSVLANEGSGGQESSTPSPAGSSASSPAKISVVISIADQTKVSNLDVTPVDIEVASSQQKGVLAVPVTALVALAEGGFGVQVVEGSSVKYVAVKTGLFAGGKVEVSGEGIAEGTVVGVPK